MKRLLPFFLILLLLLGAAACGDSEPEEKSEEETLFTVEFRTGLLPYTVAAPEPVSVKSGELISEPVLSVSHSAGYSRIWTTDESERTPYDFSAPVTESFTLYAVEIPIVYSVTFLVEHGQKSPIYFTKETETFSLKKPILDFGYKFRNWSYFDDPGSVIEEIPKGTERDLILRAVIQPATYSILYRDSENAPPSYENPNPTSYLFGDELTLEAPDAPEGYRFLGYVIYSDQATAVDALGASFVVTHKDALFKENGVSIALLAKWEKLS